MRITSLNLNYFIGKWISTAFYKHFLGVCSVLGLGDVNETKASTLHSKSMCSALTDINHSNIFFDPSPGIMEIKTNKKNRTYLNSKAFCPAKKTVSKMKRQPTGWEKICANEVIDKGLVSKIHKQPMMLNSLKTANSKMGKRPE